MSLNCDLFTCAFEFCALCSDWCKQTANQNSQSQQRCHGNRNFQI